MTDGWVRYLGLSTLFLGASFHRFFLYLYDFKAPKRVRRKELTLFLGSLSFSSLFNLFGIWGSFQASYAWTRQNIGELGAFLLIGGVIGGFLISWSVSLQGKGKIGGFVLTGLLLLSPIFFLPRLFQGWIPVWETTELSSLETVRVDREEMGFIFTPPSAGAIYIRQATRPVTIQIQQRFLSLGYRLFNLPPLYCKIKSIGNYSSPNNTREPSLAEWISRRLPQLQERLVSLTWDHTKSFTLYSLRCNSKGDVILKEELLFQSFGYHGR